MIADLARGTLVRSASLAIAYVLAGAVLSGCEGSSSTPAAESGVSQTLRAAVFPSVKVTGDLYAGSQAFGGSTIYEYALPDRKNQPPKCHDESSPVHLGPLSYENGIAVNAQHVLYATFGFRGGFGGRVKTFGPNCGPPGPTLSLPGGAMPSDVAFDNTTNTVYVTDEKSSHIYVYGNGSTSPTRMLKNSALADSLGVAVDSTGNVFQSGSRSANIVEYPKGHQMGSKVLAVSVSSARGLEFDLKGNLIVIAGAHIQVYAPPFERGPKLTMSTKADSFWGKLDAGNRNLYVGGTGTGYADVYAYPSGTFKYAIPVGNFVEGVAVDPPSGS